MKYKLTCPVCEWEMHKKYLPTHRCVGFPIQKDDESGKPVCPSCSLPIGMSVFYNHVQGARGKHICDVCETEFVKKKHTQTTCSYCCSNKKFRSGEDNGNWKEESYRTTCFLHHEKKCVVCGEENIVAVHHFNENHDDNRPENLIPLCPTHHQYCHSRFLGEVKSTIDEYLVSWKEKTML